MDSKSIENHLCKNFFNKFDARLSSKFLCIENSFCDKFFDIVNAMQF